MIAKFVRFVHEYLPFLPPFAAITILFMTLCMLLFFYTRSRGYLVAGVSATLFLVPWLVYRII